AAPQSLWPTCQSWLSSSTPFYAALATLPRVIQSMRALVTGWYVGLPLHGAFATLMRICYSMSASGRFSLHSPDLQSAAEHSEHMALFPGTQQSNPSIPHSQHSYTGSVALSRSGNSSPQFGHFAGVSVVIGWPPVCTF